MNAAVRYLKRIGPTWQSASHHVAVLRNLCIASAQARGSTSSPSTAQHFIPNSDVHRTPSFASSAGVKLENQGNGSVDTQSQLYHVHHFYQFSLQYFVDIFESVLQSAKNLTERDGKRRVDAIVQNLFSKAYQETSASLLQRDRLTFAVLLAQAAPFPMDKDLLDILLDPTITGADASANPDSKSLALAIASRRSSRSVFASTT